MEAIDAPILRELVEVAITQHLDLSTRLTSSGWSRSPNVKGCTCSPTGGRGVVMTASDRFRDALAAHNCNPRGTAARCPAHDDRRPRCR